MLPSVQSSPVHASVHLQVYESAPSVQVPPPPQGDDSHSSISEIDKKGWSSYLLPLTWDIHCNRMYEFLAL